METKKEAPKVERVKKEKVVTKEKMQTQKIEPKKPKLKSPPDYLTSVEKELDKLEQDLVTEQKKKVKKD